MLSKVIYLVAALILIDMAWSRNLGRYSELDEEDHELLRAAYDAPSYHEDYQEDDDLKLGKVDLLKDGLWALKAKVKELKAFDKALVANLISTKLKMKDMLENHLGPLKHHHHPEPASYTYHAPSYQAPHYSAPAPHYAPGPSYQQSASTNQYSGSGNQYSASSNQYGASGNQYGASGNQHGVSSSQYSSAANQYSSSAGHFSVSGNQISDYGNPGNQPGNLPFASSSSSSSLGHDPYYGN